MRLTLLSLLYATICFAVGVAVGRQVTLQDSPPPPESSGRVGITDDDQYRYSAEVVRIVDADTLWAEVDLGFRLHREVNFRLECINAPELSTAEGKAAKERLQEILPVGMEIVVRTYQDPGSYDRYTATIFLTSGSNINKWLVDNGLAVEYHYRGDQCTV